MNGIFLCSCLGKRPLFVDFGVSTCVSLATYCLSGLKERFFQQRQVIVLSTSRIAQTPILADLDRLPTLPLATRNRWSRNNKLTHRFALAHFFVCIARYTDLNTAHRSAKMAVALAFFAAVVEDMRLRDGAEDGAGCEGVDDAGAGEDSQVGESAGA